MNPPKHSPLQGVTVVDLTRAVAGPFCTMMLADLGARVVKVEEPRSGDETRHWGPPFLGSESAYFLGLNRGKESIELDLKHPTGRTAVRRLVERADVLVQNFRPGVAERLGLTYEELIQVRPGLVYAAISGFGQTGPEAGRPGYDLIVQALSGLLLACAPPGGEPVKPAVPIADVLAAHFTCQAVVAALYKRERGGGGSSIDVSLLESLLASMCPLANNALLAGTDSGPGGTTSIVPYQVFRCLDSHIVAAVPNERIWQRFCKALERPQWLEDERFDTNGNRNRHREDLLPEIAAVLRSRHAADWLARLKEHEVPAAPILSVGEVFEGAQLVERRAVVEIEHPRVGTLRLVGSPIHYGEAAPQYRPPPTLGEHTQSILREIEAGAAVETGQP